MKIRRMINDRRSSICLAAVISIGSAFLILALMYAVVMLIPAATAASVDSALPENSAPSDDPADAIRNPDSEVRGVFVTTLLNINYPSKAGLSPDALREEMDALIQTVEDAGLNAIFFQARPSGDAFYQSELFPPSAYLTGSQDTPISEEFDPLAYLCEKAHAKNIAVHAWINPLRAAYGSASSPADLESLGTRNPARLHPEWVVAYADGQLYYNAGLPEVRQLVADGIREVLTKYNVDGVLFDDYFYPYPVSESVFDDASAYETYGNGASLEDWRRSNVNALVELCYQTVKDVSSDLTFGIAPFGIWQNDDGENGGSDTRGLNAYKAIYCDALAWANGGYVDYLAPQLYWQFTTSAAEYDVLVRWWNAQLDGTGVDLLISHASYRAADWAAGEIANQVTYARSELTYRGSIFYHYVSIRDNVGGVTDTLRSLYAEEVVYTNPVSSGQAVTVTSPYNGSYLNADHSYLIGYSDPAYPLTVNGVKISRTKDGCFSIYEALTDGENTFVFRQNDEETTHVIQNNVTRPSSGTSYAVLDEFQITNVATNAYLVPGKETLTLTVTAPAGSVVTATLGNSTVTLTQQSERPQDGTLYAVSFQGEMQLPSAADHKIIDLGNIQYRAVQGKKTASATGASVRIYGAGASLSITVTHNASDFKISRSSYYYDDHTPAPIGMTDEIVSLSSGYYHLRMGGYVAEGNAALAEKAVPVAKVTSAEMKIEDGYTRIYLACDTNVPLDGFVYNNTFYFTLYNVEGLPDLKWDENNPLFGAVSIGQTKDKMGYRYFLTLLDLPNFYGYTYRYEDGYIIAEFRNPQTLPDQEKPLSGKTIILDAGHGGSDSGAAGPNPQYYEKDLNLAIVLKTAPLLRELGANVILTRSEDVTVSIYDRMDLLEETQPDLCISVHQNSIDYSKDATRVNGILSLYYADSGYLLAQAVSASLSESLHRVTRGAAQQRLAMVRNYKFPSMLVEVGFMTCIEEYSPMTGEAAQMKAAEGIVQGILNYYKMQGEYIKTSEK